TLGAVLGPLLGVALLGWAQKLHWHSPAGPFRLVLWLSIVPGLLAVVAFLWLVRDPAHSPNPALRFITSLRGLPARFKRYLRGVGLFGIGDFSHSLLILAATQLLAPSRGMIAAAQIAGMLYVLRNVTQAVASFPVGVLADRVGPLRVLVAGYTLGVLNAVLTTQAFFRQTDSWLFLAGIFWVAGLYMAVQETLESTITAALVPEENLGTSLGALGTVNGVAKFLSSSAVGMLWTLVSPEVGFGLAALAMAAGTVSLSRLPSA
ncbi:MAG: MFS transporter, partial [Aureliella sp.]